MSYLTSGILIIFMLMSLGASLGLIGLEIAASRQKNMINVALKAMAGFSCVILSFVLLGHGLMMGHSWQAMVENWRLVVPDIHRVDTLLVLIYHIPMLLAMVAMISAAVGERIRYQRWMMIAFTIGGVLWPVLTNLLWDGWGHDSKISSFVLIGFVDQGRIGSVFSIAGWFSLALLVVLGPRQTFRVVKSVDTREGLAGSWMSLPMSLRYPGMAALSLFGVGIGLVGMIIATHFHIFFLKSGGHFSSEWLGGVLLRSVVNIVLAATVSVAAGLIVKKIFFSRLSLLMVMIGTLFGGVMSVSAGVSDYQLINVAVVAAIGGVVSVVGQWLLQRLRIDDASGIVAPAILAGGWGMLAVALFPSGEHDWAKQFLLQLQALIAISGASFGGCIVLFQCMNWALALRASPEEERVGLNLLDAGVDVPTLGLIQQMVIQQQKDDFSEPVDVDPESDVAIAARIYNNVLERLHIETVRREVAALRLAQMANYDSMTGLANRRLFHDLVQRGMGRSHRMNRNGALIVMDIDLFRNINDKHGHSVGDAVLIQVSNRIADSIRETDALARLGGNQFGLLLEDLNSPETPKIVAAKILDAVTRPIAIAGNSERLSLSIGIAVFGPGQIDSVETILRKAETALKQAKISGRGVVRYYDPLSDVSFENAVLNTGKSP